MYKLLRKSFETLFTEGASAFFAKVLRKIIFVYNRITFHPYIKILPLGNKKIKFLINNQFAKEIYDNRKNINEWSELYWIRDNLLDLGDIAVDCGSNSGYTSLYFSECVGNKGKVYCFEPQPDNVRAAEINTKLNQCTNIVIESVAVGSKSGTADFIDVPNGAVGYLEGATSISVPMISLDDYFLDNAPNFLKVDVEGYEIEVLKGAKHILSSIPKLDIEIHCTSYQDRRESVDELLQLIDLCKYDIFLQLERNSIIQHYEHDAITAELISRYDNIHLFAVPKNTACKERKK